jgi:DNA-binding NarL/FixJ family response regulator
MRFQILVVEEHPILREGIKAILDIDDEFQVMGETEHASGAVDICKKQLPDVILIGHPTPSRMQERIETTAKILNHNPDAKIILFSLSDDEGSVLGAIRSGVRGFVLMKATGPELRDAVRTVAKGSAYLSPEISSCILRRIRTGEPQAGPNPFRTALAPREVQIMQLVAEGNSSKEIAAMLGLCVQTVRSYRKTVMKKLEVRNAAGLTRLAIATGAAR